MYAFDNGFAEFNVRMTRNDHSSPVTKFIVYMHQRATDYNA